MESRIASTRGPRNSAVQKILREGRLLRRGWEKSLSSPTAMSPTALRSRSNPRPSTVVQSIISIQVSRKGSYNQTQATDVAVPVARKAKPRRLQSSVSPPIESLVPDFKPELRFPEVWLRSNFRVSIVHVEDKFASHSNSPMTYQRPHLSDSLKPAVRPTHASPLRPRLRVVPPRG